MGNYRKVYCKDRLPNDNERYDTNIGTLRFYPKEKKGQQWKDGFLDSYYHPRYWFEPTPEPPADGPTIQGKGEGLEVKGRRATDIESVLIVAKVGHSSIAETAKQLEELFKHRNQSKGDEVKGVTVDELKSAFQEIIWPFYNKALDNETGVGDVSDVIDRLVATAEEYASQPPANKKGE